MTASSILRKAIKAAGTTTAGIGLAGQSEDAGAGVISKGGKKIIEAFHGSPHTFDKFSMANIGTGEGAQAYGHGLYFADSEDVARGYRDTLGYRGFDMDAETSSRGIDLIPSTRAEVFRQTRANPDASPQDIARRIQYANRPARDIDQDTLVDLVSAYQDKSKGALYRAHIDVDPDTLLDWDKPLSEQSEAAKDAAAELLTIETGVVPGHPNFDSMVQNTRAQIDSSGMLGGEFMQKAQKAGNAMGAIGEHQAAPFMRRGDEFASSYLKDRGIPGIRYADGMSRGKDGGTYNYVMFDDKPISIQERGNASPEMLAATATGSAAATGLLDPVFDALELPWKGYLGATRMAGGLLAGEGFDEALDRGVRQVRQPVEETADELGGAATDATGRPEIGTLAYLMTLLGGPI